MEQPAYSTRAGTIGGTLLVVIIQVNTGELVRTAILAAIGASVSFGVTWGWKWVIKWWKKKGL
jgi:hypothetical protein